jgi:RNA polymerase primary sigma factor
MLKTSRRRSPSAVQTPLETYLREINETALLNAKEEKELSYQIHDGNKESRDRMVRANLRLVVNIARAYTSKGLPLQDLIEEGNLGLLRAVEGFDPGMNTRFSTYASYWIKQSIKRALVNSAKTIRIPAYMVELLSKWRRATAQLQDELNRTPTADEVAKVLGLPKKKLKIVKKAIQLYNSTPQSDATDSGWSLGEMIADDRIKGPEDELIDSDNMTHVLQMLELMDPRESTILRMRFGLDDSEPRTLKEIGETLGLTRERVRQIENDALDKLAKGLNGENVECPVQGFVSGCRIRRSARNPLRWMLLSHTVRFVRARSIGWADISFRRHLGSRSIHRCANADNSGRVVTVDLPYLSSVHSGFVLESAIVGLSWERHASEDPICRKVFPFLNLRNRERRQHSLRVKLRQRFLASGRISG